MKEREEIIRNKGSGHEIRENCLRVTSFRDILCMFVVLVFSTIVMGQRTEQ